MEARKKAISRHELLKELETMNRYIDTAYTHSIKRTTIIVRLQKEQRVCQLKLQ